MAYKGVLPSDLWDRYDCEGGSYKMQLDMIVAAEISDKISEATRDAKTDAKGAVARRNQRREQRKYLSDGGDVLQAIKDSGMPIKGKSGDSTA
jgi:hypothetical protein